MTKWTFAALVGGLTLSLTGCSGSDGVDGLDGVDGVNGTNGADGADGADGDDGAPGTDGTDGDDGTDGADGHDGWSGHNGIGPWGVNLTIIGVTGGTGTDGAFAVGDTPVVEYTLLDDDGVPYELADLTGFYFHLAGPTSNYAIAIYYSDLASVATTSLYDWSTETWTYTFSEPIPATYHAPPNDTTDLDLDDGDMGGEALVEGTYTLAAWAYLRQYNPDGSYYYEADNTTNDLLLGNTATVLETREVVLAENCASCHGDAFMAHGGSRRDLGVCLTCHVGGGEDRYSATDSTTTPGVTINMGNMIHKMHMGESLENGIVINGYPSDPDGAGYPNYNEFDFSEVGFPAWPMEAATCDSCHANATDGDVENRPTRDACGACHDGIDFLQADTAAEDYHSGGVQTDDTNCTVCHTADTIVGYHEDPRDDTSFNAGINVDIVDAYNQDGAATFEVGDTLTVEYTVTDDSGANVSNALWGYSSSSSTCGTVAGSATVIFTGPTSAMTRVMYSPSPSSTTTLGSLRYASTYDETTGVYTYTFADSTGVTYPIPETYGAQISEDGDRYGMALEAGTYRIGMDIYTNLWDDPSGDCNRVRVADSDYFDVLLGGATALEPREVIDEAGCENCHNVIEFHGSGRIGVNYCMMCHTAGQENSDLPGMIHRIHGSSEMSGGSWCFEYEDDGTCGEEFDVTFPRQDGGVRACTACHSDNTEWKEPTARGCVTCHDSEDAAAHAAINTDDTYGESCEVCHGDGREFSAETVHAYP